MRLYTLLKEIITRLKDYKVESGEYNGWVYEKWASGKFEAWLYKSYGSIDFSSVVITNRLWKNDSYYPLSLSLPFTVTKINHVSGGWKNGSWAISCIYNMSTYVNVYVANLLSGTISSNELNLYVKGTWK